MTPWKAIIVNTDIIKASLAGGLSDITADVISAVAALKSPMSTTRGRHTTTAPIRKRVDVGQLRTSGARGSKVVGASAQ